MSEIDESASDDELMLMVKLARAHAARGEAFCADVYYRAILNATGGLKTPVQRLAGGEACARTAEQALAKGMIGTACDWYRRATIADPLCAEHQAALAQALSRMADLLGP